MRTQLVTFVALNLVLVSVALAAKQNHLNVLLSNNLQGELEGSLEIEHGLFKSTAEVIELKNLKKGPNRIALLKPVDIKQIKVHLRLLSRANLKDDLSETVKIKGVLIPGKEFKKGDMEIVGRDLKTNISCRNIMRSKIENDGLVLDLSEFRNISDCTGEDLPIYSPFYIGNRKVDDGANWFSMDDDVRMGREYAETYIKDNADKILPIDHPTTVYMQEKMELIAKKSDMPNLKPKVRVINADVLNAFALPGGYVFVFRGLMEKSPSEAALMGVLGHEWAHVTTRHGTRGMTRAIKTTAVTLGISLAAQIAAGSTGDKVTKTILALVGAGSVAGGQLRLLSKGREQELEADRIGSQYALLAGYHPRGIGDMFETFKKEKGGSSTTLETILSSHPDHDTRIERNHILSALFYPARPDYVSTSVGYEVALAAVTGEPMPRPEETVKVATSFIEGLQKQQETIVIEYLKKYVKTSSEVSH